MKLQNFFLINQFVVLSLKCQKNSENVHHNLPAPEESYSDYLFVLTSNQKTKNIQLNIRCNKEKQQTLTLEQLESADVKYFCMKND